MTIVENGFVKLNMGASASVPDNQQVLQKRRDTSGTETHMISVYHCILCTFSYT